jgi:outer membrane protein assembly factor BamB
MKKYTVIALLLIISMTISFAAITSTYGATTYTKKTYAFIGATPNPVGVGMETLLHIGISDELMDVSHGWEGLTATITRPDNTTETLGPFRTDSTGGTGAIYVPTMIGTYYLQTHFPAQWYNWTARAQHPAADIWFEATSSEKLALNVTEEPSPIYPGVPLPTEYWSRPIDSQLHEWYQISNSWTMTPDNLYAKYNQGPESSHILWRTPLMMGGLAGGEEEKYNFNVGGGGQSPWPNSVILGGIHIYNRFYSAGERNVVAVDVHTGEELWVRNNSAVSFGQRFRFDAANQHATFMYWWRTVGTTWEAYDPLTGRYVWSVTNVPSGTTVVGPRGDFYRYVINLEQGTAALWNMTAVVTYGGGGSWNPSGQYNGTRGAPAAGLSPPAQLWAWNTTLPTGLPGTVRKIYHDDIMLGYYRGGPVLTRVEAGPTLNDPPFYAWAVSLKPESRGQLLWNRTYKLPSGNLTLSFGATCDIDRVWTVRCKEERSHRGFDLDTGEPLWGPTPSQGYLDMYGMQNQLAYGKLISNGYGGIVYAYNARTGALEWTYEVEDRYNTVLWGNQWPIRTAFITDGKIYLTHGEHSPVAPLMRDAPFICLDAETGEEVWSINGAFRGAEWGGRAIIGDSVMVVWDSFDNMIYGVAKGPSFTSVTASPKVSVHGSSVLLEGTVIDVSPGMNEVAMKMRFPNGVPAVSDESMSDWMKYVYKQFPRPTNTAGVEVTIDVLDANGNYRNIGTAISDSSGMFRHAWRPDIEGTYTVIATFAGSKSYWPSYAQTAFVIDPATTTPATTQPIIPVSSADMYLLPGIITIIVAIVIVGALIMLMLRKRP